MLHLLPAIHILINLMILKRVQTLILLSAILLMRQEDLVVVKILVQGYMG